MGILAGACRREAGFRPSCFPVALSLTSFYALMLPLRWCVPGSTPPTPLLAFIASGPDEQGPRVSAAAFMKLLLGARRVCVLLPQASRLGEVVKVIPRFVFHS